MCESGERSEAALAELLDCVEELLSQGPTLGLLAMLVAKQFTQGVHLLVDGLEGGVGFEQFVAALVLSLGEASGVLAQGGETAAVVLELGSNGAHEDHEMVLNDSDDMEAVRHDPCPQAGRWNWK